MEESPVSAGGVLFSSFDPSSLFFVESPPLAGARHGEATVVFTVETAFFSAKLTALIVAWLTVLQKQSCMRYYNHDLRPSNHV